VNDTSANYDSVTNKYVADTDANAQVYLVNGTDKQNVTKYFYVNAAEQSDGTTNLTVAIKDLKALLLLGTTEEVTQYKKDAEGNDTTETETVDVFTSYYTITGTTQIVVEYTAVLNEDAVTAPSSNDNTVNITYSNNPNSSGTATTTPPSDTPPTDEPTPEDGQPTGETVEEETKTYTTALVITKKNENNKILTGAKFTLTGNGVNIVIVTKDVFTKVTPQEEIDNGDEQENLEQADDGSESTTPVYYYKLADGSYTTKAPTDNTMDKYEEDASAYTKETVTEVMGVGKTSTAVTATVGDDGVVTFTGLGAGDYTLTETEPPTGYNTMTPVSFTISYKNGAFSSDRDDIVYDATDGEFDMTVIDKPGSTLPRTGGIGTTIFYVVGTILVLSAGILLITKKRMGREVR
jgi:LPXTG-motif cell wall-anchored protein